MKKYIINEETNAILATERGSNILSKNTIESSIHNPLKVVKKACKYYGSNLSGRIDASKEILSANYKVPIIISEAKKIILFPTKSLKSKECSWINVNKIENYKRKNDSQVEILFSDKKTVTINISIRALENSILLAIKLSNIIINR